MPKAIEEALMKEAEKKKFKGKKKEAYIWGGLRKTGWKPRKEKEVSNKE